MEETPSSPAPITETPSVAPTTESENNKAVRVGRMELPDPKTQEEKSSKVVPSPELSAKLRAALGNAIQDDGQEGYNEPPPEKTEETSSAPPTETKTEEVTSATLPATEEKPSETTSSLSTLPAAFRRSLKAVGYSDEEIDAAVSLQGEKFINVARKIHDSRNRESQEWAKLGRAKSQGLPPAQPGETTPAPPAVNPAAQKTLSEIATIDVDALKKEYGDVPLIQQLSRVNALIPELNKLQAQAQSWQEQQRQVALENLGQRVHSFFGSADMTDFHEHYGNNPDALSDDQIKNRHAVLDMANAMITGASAQGRSLPVGQALQFAHDALTADQVETKARQKIQAEIAKRNASTTLRPAGRQDPIGRKSSETRTKVRAGLAKAFKQ